MADALSIFLPCPPGLEAALREEAAEIGLPSPRALPGGVESHAAWEDIWRANLWLRGATRVLVRLGIFRAGSLPELEAAARRFPWLDHLAAREPVRLDITCRKSRIAHAGAAAQKLERALRTLQIPVAPKAELTVKVRIERDTCILSIDTSGAPLHLRGHKQAVGKAPLRETLAALFLRECGYAPGEPVMDPMCGSGTFVIEAAEIAMGLPPGRDRRFAFERLPSFNPARYAALKGFTAKDAEPVFFGSDRDEGAVRGAQANARRAGVLGVVDFQRAPVSELTARGGPGLVMVNPPYGERIGNRQALFSLYRTLGDALRAPGFSGWRLGMVTSDGGLAKATGLELSAGPPVAFGGLKVKLYQARL
ncbi:MAG: class I SAM-dependent RNA methyltransferase [Pseudomonadota bacterium]